MHFFCCLKMLETMRYHRSLQGERKRLAGCLVGYATPIPGTLLRGKNTNPISFLLATDSGFSSFLLTPPPPTQIYAQNGPV